MRGGDEDVAARLPLFHRQRSGDFSEHVAESGEDAGFAAADEAGEFGGAAMVEGIVGAELADQLADRGFARFGEEVFRGGSGVGGFPAARRDQALVHARDCAVDARPGGLAQGRLSSDTRFAPFRLLSLRPLRFWP